MQQMTTQRNLNAHKLEELRGLVVQYSFWLKKEGYKDSTIEGRGQIMHYFVKNNVDILSPDAVKEALANFTCGESRKRVIASTYTNFLKMLGRTWEKPRYRAVQKIPHIPTEKELDQLIANAGQKTSAALRVAKETGARIGEILNLKWTDVDSERRTVKFEAEKGSNPRILPVSSKLIATLLSLPKKNEYVFSTPKGHGSQKDYSRMLSLTRKYAARKLQNPRLLQIHFHTLRHWKGTMEYHKTKDIMHVKAVLGHKSITNTMIYINLEQALFHAGDSSEYTTRVAKTVKGVRALLEAGFEYVIEMDGVKLFRKRK